MANLASVTGRLRGNFNLFKDIIRTLIFAVLAAVIIIGGVVLWRHHENTSSSRHYRPASLSQVESANQKYNNSALSSGELSSYEISQQTLAIEYLNNKDPANALRIMNEVFKKVPAEKVDSSSYIVMVSIEKALGDKVQYKHYLELLVAKLKAEGKTSQADQYQKVLDGQ
jgi:hypothetical protein